jgi:hypothetical protein
MVLQVTDDVLYAMEIHYVKRVNLGRDKDNSEKCKYGVKLHSRTIVSALKIKIGLNRFYLRLTAL